MQNRTKQDARDRVALARVGSLAEATEPYLDELGLALAEFLAEVETEQAIRIRREFGLADADADADGAR